MSPLLKFIAYLVSALLCLGIPLAGCSSQGGASEGGPPRSAISGPLPAKGDLLFVMRGPSTVTEGPATRREERRRGQDGQPEASVDKRDPEADARLRGVHDRIEVTADAVEWFTDRPQRKAGIAAAHDLVDRWKGYGFDERPPNASVAGPGTDAVVELRNPQKTRDGVAFEAVGIRGELPAKRDAELSLFIDSSEWKTDMHVNVKSSNFCDNYNETMELRNPVIETAPHNWSVPPPQDFVVARDNEYHQIFNAASSSGTTSFKVQYTLVCDDDNYLGGITFTGKVPDNLNSNSFNCNGARDCKYSHTSGYHTSAYAEITNADPPP